MSDYALSGAQVEELGRRLPGWLGVFARDELDHLPPLPDGSRLVANLDAAGRPGTHWVALLRSGQVVYYVSSLGDLPPDEVISLAGRSGCTELAALVRSLQADGSATCGWYAVYFASSRSPSDLWRRLLELQPYPSLANDRRVLATFGIH